MVKEISLDRFNRAEIIGINGDGSIACILFQVEITEQEDGSVVEVEVGTKENGISLPKESITFTDEEWNELNKFSDVENVIKENEII